ncbi:MAG: phenylphosphate carboxylase subunit delta [Planctomycetaceae bacterium]|jgi:3-deoxy-D-manno-octulosonate 8-phosphate phosphatase (KDO 8-P phosphatase)|nr:phenylphosphate carboxylase subunit delta [Planctomycetaceae bacterium]MBD16248.1 phenylphosphate carboxylase subunit delta [Planctomycetaceae bacterium]MCH2595391.1 HAD hydrolase family protein [Pirellulales bacterium]HCK40691.1 phenylphosphate carboxylase subunit delta [Planctomycetaceae bacterium]|tara:strand:+ start:271 stop:795 length:525 start_codon:yes stop_codon:yes gene_type:complete
MTKLADKCKNIRLILTDVDGVLTDGRVIIDNRGIESKQFHIRDGQGIRLWQQSGGCWGIVTGRSSQVVKLRAAELDIDIVRQGVSDKLQVVRSLCEEMEYDLSQVCFVGDDLPDWQVIQAVGLGVAVADAAEELLSSADYVTSLDGGSGAIRELVEVLLKNTGCWDSVLRKYAS